MEKSCSKFEFSNETLMEEIRTLKAENIVFESRDELKFVAFFSKVRTIRFLIQLSKYIVFNHTIYYKSTVFG